MSDCISFPAEEFDHLIIEEMAQDALVRGTTEGGTIEVSYQPLGGNGAVPHLLIEDGEARLSGALAVRVILPSSLSATIKNAPGDLRVQNLAGDINLEGVRGDLRLARLEGVARIAQVDGSIRAERVADVHLLGSCNGDLRIELGQRLSAEAVAGDVRLYDVAEARLERVRGDLWAEKLRGSLQVNRADGDARLSEIAGPVVIRSVTGDLRASALTAGLTAQQVSGDAALSGPFGEAQEGYALSAEGDVSLHLQADADVRLSVRAGGRIRSDLQLTPTADGSPTFSATLGRGTHRIVLSSGGDLRIVRQPVPTPLQGSDAASRQGDAAPQAGKAQTQTAVQGEPWPASDIRSVVDVGDLSGLGERIRQQVNASLAAAGVNVSAEEPGGGRRGLLAHPGPHGAAGAGGERGRGGAGTRGSRPPGPERQRSTAPVPTASLEEQVAVMQMLAEGKITSQEADVLLKALGA